MTIAPDLYSNNALKPALRELHKNHPFILAGLSQGSVICTLLLQNYFKKYPELLQAHGGRMRHRFLNHEGRTHECFWSGVTVLSEFNGKPTAVMQGNLLEPLPDDPEHFSARS